VAAAAVATSPSAGIPAAGGAAGTGAGELRRMNLIDGGPEFLAGRGEVLQQLDFAIEVNDGSFVLVFAENAIEEGAAGGEFLAEDTALAETAVDQEA